MTRSPRWLLGAAVLSFGIALLHLAIIFAGPDAYAYFGAPDLGASEAAGNRTPDLLTALLVVLFTLFGCYALSGAGRIRRLPLLTFALLAIGAIFTLRGLAVVVETPQIVRGSATFPTRYAVFSLVALITGVCFLMGVIADFRALGARRRAGT